MRNLKKILALVLALVMVIGMMSITSAATPGTGYADDADITKFDESIQILTALGIYKGDGEGEFEPNDPITRAEVAALVYRIVHDEKYVGIYADYNKFDDVNSKDWFAGYVNYCANGEFIVGDGRGNFNPDDYVDGYQVLAIVLRAIGYDREGEFQGAGWEVRTARKAKELGITKNIVEGTLGAPATRAMVAELIYRAIAQTSTVSWNLLTSYKANNVTLAYETFGLQGQLGISPEGGYDAEDYKLMTVREGADADIYYGEPVASWYVNDTDGGLYDNSAAVDYIEIRFNPVKSYTSAVATGTLYADAGLKATTDSYYYAVDGDAQADLTLAKKGATVIAGNGVETDLFVVEGKVYVISKQPYVGEITTAYKVPTGKTYGEVAIDGVVLVDYYALTKGLTKGTKVLYNMYDNNVDYATFQKAASQVVTVGSTYDNLDLNTSYFKAGNTKYNYSYNLHMTDDEKATSYPKAVEDVDSRRDYIMNGSTDDNLAWNYARFGLGDKVEVFFDKYGNVILLDDPAQGFAAGGVGVVIGADTLRISLGKYVLELDMIMADGSRKTVKGVTKSVEGWDFRENVVDGEADTLMDEGVFMTQYTIDAETGYYVLVEYDPTVAAEYVFAINKVNDNIIRGDANMPHSYLLDVDSTTTYIVETYKNNGKDVKGYTTYKGFKAVPSLEKLGGNYAPEYEAYWTYNAYTMSFVVFVVGATKAEQPAAVTVDELVYVLESVPEKNLTKDEDGNSITYWTYTVVKNGQVTTLKSTVEIDKTGLYEITKNGELRNFYDLEWVYDQQATLVACGWGVPAYADVLYGLSGKVTLADSVKVYSIDKTELTELTLADLKAGMTVEYLVDKYGYATTIYVVDPLNGDLDYHAEA